MKALSVSGNPGKNGNTDRELGWFEEELRNRGME